MFFLGCLNSTYTHAGNINDIINSLNELVTQLKYLNGNISNVEELGNSTIVFFEESWPYIMENINKIANLPEAITFATTSINNALPYVQGCLYVTGGTILLSTIIYSATRVVLYLAKKKQKNSSLYPDYEPMM